MAATASLVFAGPNLLRYAITGDGAGGTATIPNDGGASPDLLTDSTAGPLKSIMRARLDGIGTIAPGALNQAQARALLLSDDAVSVGNERVPRAITRITSRSAAAAASVDADVDGQGDPVIAATVAANEVAYVDIEIPGAIGSAVAS